MQRCVITGPDAQNTHSILLSASVAQDTPIQRELKLDFFASELRLRGDEPVVQPHANDKGDVLCWNGEVYLFYSGLFMMALANVISLVCCRFLKGLM